MSTQLKTFEVKLLVDGLTRIYHYSARTHDQAAKRAGKKGRVLGVRKVDITDWCAGIEKMKLEQEPLGYYIGGGMYEKDINLDNVLGLNKPKRNRRSKNNGHKVR